MAQITSKPLDGSVLQKNRRILIVEDERDLAELIAFNLTKAGYRTTVAHDGKAALKRLAEDPPDLVVLDLMLPEVPGTEIASRIRTNPSTSRLPIIMLTAKADELDQLVGLAVGADDYITKPFSVKLLLARIEAVLRRSEDAPATTTRLHLGPVELDLGSHKVTVGTEQIHLTLTEFRLLAALMQAQGRVLSRRHLMSKAMGPGVTVTERTIDVHMTAIRKKLGEQGNLITTVRGVGYRAVNEPEGSEV